jgi:hypothetical protein
MNQIPKTPELTRALDEYRRASQASTEAFASADADRIVAAGEALNGARAALAFAVDTADRRGIVESLSGGQLAALMIIRNDGLTWPREYRQLEAMGLIERTRISLAIEHHNDYGRLILTEFGRDALRARTVEDGLIHAVSTTRKGEGASCGADRPSGLSHSFEPVTCEKCRDLLASIHGARHSSWSARGAS